MTSTVRRALVAYCRTIENGPPVFGGIVERSHEGLRYVVVHGQDAGVLAVYRITGQGQLKRLKRWPEAVAAGDNE